MYVDACYSYDLISDISTLFYSFAEIRLQPESSNCVNGNRKLDSDIPDIGPGYLTVYDEGSLANIPRGCESDWDYLKEIGIVHILIILLVRNDF